MAWCWILRKLNIFQVGQIIGFHGLNGILKITPLYKGLFFKPGQMIWLNELLKFQIKDCRAHQKHLLLECLELQENKQILQGQNIFYAGKIKEILPPDTLIFEEFKDKDIISTQTGSYLGRAQSWFYSGMQMTLEILNEKKRQTWLLPAIPGVFIQEIQSAKILVNDQHLAE
jgi:ribosomal 30S subunit maturation factor RimM